MRDLIPYFRDVVRILEEAGATAADLLLLVDYGNQYGTLTAALHYSDGSTLYVELSADCSHDVPIWGDYGFHYQDRGGRLRFRYDNAPHHRQLPNFPHHLHLPSSEVSPEGPPSIRAIAKSIRDYLE